MSKISADDFVCFTAVDNCPILVNKKRVSGLRSIRRGFYSDPLEKEVTIPVVYSVTMCSITPKAVELPMFLEIPADIKGTVLFVDGREIYVMEGIQEVADRLEISLPPINFTTKNGQ